jgi:hypothetical protein
MVFIADSLKRPNGWLCSISNAASTFSSASVAFRSMRMFSIMYS